MTGRARPGAAADTFIWRVLRTAGEGANSGEDPREGETGGVCGYFHGDSKRMGRALNQRRSVQSERVGQHTYTIS